VVLVQQLQHVDLLVQTLYLILLHLQAAAAVVVMQHHRLMMVRMVVLAAVVLYPSPH
jgi:hypothetical protein